MEMEKSQEQCLGFLSLTLRNSFYIGTARGNLKHIFFFSFEFIGTF